MYIPEGFYPCTDRGQSQILHRTSYNASRSGIITTYQGGLLTAASVPSLHHLPDFISPSIPDIDVAYKPNDSVDGMPLGWVNVYELENVELVTSSDEKPCNMVSILGRLGLTLPLTQLQPFIAYTTKRSRNYPKPGINGSPLIYNHHIIGVLSTKRPDPYFEDLPLEESRAVIFNGPAMYQAMTDIGLPLPEKPLIKLKTTP